MYHIKVVNSKTTFHTYPFFIHISYISSNNANFDVINVIVLLHKLGQT